MQDGDDVPGSRALEVLIALRRHVKEEAVGCVGEEGLRFYFGVDRLGENIVKSQAKDVRAEVIDVCDSSEVVPKSAFAGQPHLFSTLIHRRVAGAAIEHAEIIEIEKGGVAGPGPKFSLRGPSPCREILSPDVSVQASIDGPEQRFTQDRSLHRGGPDIGNEESRLSRDAFSGQRSERKIQHWDSFYAKNAVINLGSAADVDHDLLGIELP